MRAVLHKHFEKMNFIESSSVNMAAQTASIVNVIRKTNLTLSAANIDGLVDSVTNALRSSDDEEEDGSDSDAEEGRDENEHSNRMVKNNAKAMANKLAKTSSIHGEDKADMREKYEHIIGTDHTFTSDDIRKLVTALDGQVEEYSKVLMIPSTYSIKFKESLKECNHAADQLAQQVKIIEDRSLETSKQYFDSLSDDEHKGGTARLVRSIGINVQSVEDSTRKLQADITASRKEFLKMSHLNGLLEVAPHHSYEKVRDTFAHIRRLSQKKSDESNKQWLQFEKKCREKQFAEMRRMYDQYVGSSDPAAVQAASEEGIQSFESKLKEHRVRVNHKLMEFNNKVIEISDRNIDKITGDADVFLSWRHKIIPWELREQQDMEAWLASSVTAVEDQYSAAVEGLRAHHSQVLAQIDTLTFHRQKLAHLHRLSAKKQRSMRERSAKIPRPKATATISSGSSSLAAKGRGGHGGKLAAPCMEDLPVPETSMRLGSRVVNLGKLVCIEEEECLLLLNQMLHDVSADAIVAKRLQYFITHYTKLSGIQRNAGKS